MNRRIASRRADRDERHESGHRTVLTLGGGRAVVTLNGKVLSDEPYTPASDYIRECIAAGLCTRCDGRGVTEYWVGTQEHLKCDTCGRRWFRGYPYREVPLFDTADGETVGAAPQQPEHDADADGKASRR